ncbi:DUF502 domain-containing protein [Candidatus Protochlamydia sp. W-9]|uniref:DUF502 domain-containing protein n=1 Tax=Candidatus Protochlamydia sp. W-9 TaxID=1785087 RepID=UPI00096A375E|nr:DUF502 domain-containing protein [Candidatus Protochlamydia sp. W-9]
MKKYFITGLVILLPAALTIGVVIFIFNLLTTPFLGIVKIVFEQYGLFERGFLFLNSEQFQNILAQILILTSLFFITILLGLIGRWFFFRSVIKFAEYLFRNIPLVNTVYNTCKDVIKTLFNSKANSFKQVVLVRFPNPSTYSIGFITKEGLLGLHNTPFENSSIVFIPTTPNPTSGFLLVYRQEDILYLDMKVEEAFKYIISCGMITPSFHPIQKKPDSTPSYELNTPPISFQETYEI